MPTRPEAFFGLSDASGLRPCDRTHLKNGLVLHSYAGGVYDKYRHCTRVKRFKYQPKFHPLFWIVLKPLKKVFQTLNLTRQVWLSLFSEIPNDSSNLTIYLKINMTVYSRSTSSRLILRLASSLMNFYLSLVNHTSTNVRYIHYPEYRG